MPTPVLICDDSKLARKQMARALPEGWDVAVTFAANGAEGVEAIKAGNGDVTFLDLNMPVMDGYQVLEAIRSQDLPSMVIVVSGDIQPEARERVMALGALDFIKKPVDSDEIAAILERYGLYEGRVAPAAVRTADMEVEAFDTYQEIANVAMGRAADLLARLLGVFVVLPIPKVSNIARGELRMALSHAAETDRISAVCQGFIGAGIAGEALLVFNESSFTDIADLMHYDGEITDAVEVELLMDLSNVLIGACLKGVGDQLDINFSQGHPVVLGRHVQVDDLMRSGAAEWNETLCIEIGWTIEERDISCDLILLFTEDSVGALDERVRCFVL